MAFAQRLGLFHTQEELNHWRDKVNISNTSLYPYKTKGDLPDNWDRMGSNGVLLPNVSPHRTNSPAGLADIIKYADQFKASPTAKSYTNYYQGANPWAETPNNNTTFDPGNGGTGTGLEISCAAFMYMIYRAGTYQDLTKANSYGDKVVQNIKDTYKGQGYANYGGKKAFDWNDNKTVNGVIGRFMPGSDSWGEVNPGFAIAQWMCFLINAFEYTQDHPAWADADKLDFKNWIVAGAMVMLKSNEIDGTRFSLNSLFVDRAGRNYSIGGEVKDAQAVIDEGDLIYYGGPRHRKVERFYGNKRSTMYGFIGLAGIFTNTQYLIDKAKKYFEEMFMFGIYPDGTHTDGHRGMAPDHESYTAFGYAILGTMYNFCEALARKGDRGGLVNGVMTFGYEFTTLNGSVTQKAYTDGRHFPISGSGTGLNDTRDCSGMGGAKGPKMHLDYLAKRATFQPPFHYLTHDSGQNGNFTYLFKYKRVNVTNHPCYDCQWIMQAKYYGGMNTTPLPFGLFLKQVARREYGTIHDGQTMPGTPGSIPWSSDPDNSGKLPDAWGGSHFIQTLFLYDNRINPYPFSIGDPDTPGTSPQSIDFDPLPTSYTYGDPSFLLGASASSNLPVTYSQSGTGTVSIDGSGNCVGTKAGTVTIRANQSGGLSGGIQYDPAPYVERTFTIAKRNLTVAIQDVPTGRIYNRLNSTVTFSAAYSNWKTGEGTSALDTIPSFHCPTALQSSAPGSGTNTIPAGGTFTRVGGYVTGNFVIVVNQAGASANYNFVYTYGQLTINKGLLDFAITSELNKTTASSDFTPTLLITERGTTNVVNPAAPISLTIVWTKGTGTSVTSVNSSTGFIDLSGTTGETTIGIASTTNTYYFIHNTFTFKVVVTTVSQLPQTITFAQPSDGNYGDSPGTFTYTPGPGSAPVIFESANPEIVLLSGTNNVNYTIIKSGDTTITARQGAGGGYEAAPDVSQPFHINKKLLTITPDEESRPYGEENPDFTYTVTGGFVSPDDESDITTPPTITTSAVKTTPVGDQSVYAYDAEADNYAFTYADGVMHIVKAEVNIIGFDSLPDKFKNADPFLLPGTTDVGRAVTYVLNSGPTGLTLVNGLITIGSGLGEVSVTASCPGDTNYEDADEITQTFDIINPQPRVQTLTPTIGSVFVYGDPAFSVKVTSDSGLTVALSIVEEVPKGTLAGSTSPTTCSIIGAGTISIRAFQAGNDDWLEASAVYTVTINKKSQSITAPTITDKLVTAPDFSITASVNSGEPLIYYTNNALLSQPAPTENLFHIVGAGGASISVRQVGSDNYFSTEKTLLFNILPVDTSQVNLLTRPGVIRKKGHRTVAGRTQYFWRFTNIPDANSIRYVLKYKKFNIPKHFKVTEDDDTLHPVIEEDNWDTTKEICDVTLATPRAVTEGIIEWSSIGTSSDVNNLLSFEVFGTLL